MFGRVRAASSSPESLEMERPPSNKFFKHHSLSIYEATLMKLRDGSRWSTNAVVSPLSEEDAVSSCNMSSTATTLMESMTDDPSSQHIVALPDGDAMIIDPDCASSGHSTSFPPGESVGGSGQRPSRDVSIVYLFHRYNNSAHSVLGPPSSDGEALESAGGSAATGSLASVDGRWPNSGSSSSVGMR